MFDLNDLTENKFESCSFNLKQYEREFLRWFYSADLGSCFQLNFKPPLFKSIFQGIVNGLKVIICPLKNANKNYSGLYKTQFI